MKFVNIFRYVFTYFFLISLNPIVEYIDNQFEAYHTAERSSEFRRAIPDTRIHALLYFIPPTGHAYVMIFKTYHKNNNNNSLI
jgi:hypothetical protein